MSDIKRVVSTSLWEDEKVVNLFSPEDKYFLLYLLTNPHTTQLGIYRLVPKQAAFELGYSEDTVRVLLDRFQNKYDMICFSEETSEVAIKNFLSHSIVKGGKPVMDCLLKEESQVKDKSLLLYIYNSISSKDNINNTVKEYIEHISKLDCLKELNTLEDNKSINNYIYNDNERFVDESWTNRPDSSKSTGNKRVFEPPTAYDVEQYCIEKSYFYVFPEEFVSFYGSKNWMVGKNKMTNWRQAVAGWNSRSQKRGEAKNKKLMRRNTAPTQEPEQEQTAEEFEQMVRGWE